MDRLTAYQQFMGMSALALMGCTRVVSDDFKAERQFAQREVNREEQRSDAEQQVISNLMFCYVRQQMRRMNALLGPGFGSFGDVIVASTLNVLRDLKDHITVADTDWKSTYNALEYDKFIPESIHQFAVDARFENGEAISRKYDIE